MENKKLTHPVSGVITPTITFFDTEGRIAPDANQLLLHHVIANGSDCLFVMGSTGEGRYFKNKFDEKRRYIQLVKDTIPISKKPHIPIIIGVYGETPSEVIMDAENILKIIPDAGLVIPPPTTLKLNPTDQLEFYNPILRTIHAPIYAYNNPNSFGNTNLDLHAMSTLKAYPNFKGLKDSSGSSEQKKIYLSLQSLSFTVSCGKEGMIAQFLQLTPANIRAQVGIVPSIANLTRTCAEIVALGIAGKIAEMMVLQENMNHYREKVYDSIQENGKAQRGLKIAFAHLYKTRGIRIPITVNPKLFRNISQTERASIESQTDFLVSTHQISIIP
jgi:4-hydroxy-tetrahydrodipicolinate synthase